MLTLQLELPDDTAIALLGKARAHEMAIEKYLLQLIEQVLVDGEEAEPPAEPSVLDACCEQAKHFKVGSKFHLVDVTPPDVWKKLAPGERKQLGRKFKKAVQGHGIAKYLRLGNDNHAVYERIAG